MSVIILNFNGEAFLKPCLLSVQEAILPRTDVEVILADNRSTDESISVTRQTLPTAKILSLDRNYGFAEANNRAAEVAHGEYLVFLNNDTVTDKEWLQKLIEVADSDPSIAICGSRIMFLDSKDRINYAGGKITMIGSGYDQRFGMKEERLNNTAHITGYACGASMLVKKSTFHRLGGFDQSYFALCEDVDLSWRAWIAGFKVIHVPTSIVYHKFSGSWNQEEDKVYYWHRNCKVNIIKIFETFAVIRGLTLIFLFDILRVLEGIRRSSIRTLRSVVLGYNSVLSNSRRILEARLLVSRLRGCRDSALHEMGIFASFQESLLEYRRARKDARAPM